VIAVGALDSSALFHERVQAAGAEAGGIAVLLGAAQALGAAWEAVEALPKQPMVALFQAEAFGHLGSYLFARDTTDFTCERTVTAADSPTGRPYCSDPLRADLAFTNVSLASVHAALAVLQPAWMASAGAAYAHQVRPSAASARVSAVVASVASSSPASLPFTARNATAGVAPPSPLDTLTSGVVPGLPNATLPLATGVVALAGFDASFADPWWRSSFDDGLDSGRRVAPNATDALVGAATLLARTLFALATGIDDPSQAAAAVPASVVADATLVQSVYECITVDARCDLFRSALAVSEKTLEELTPFGTSSLYTSVYLNPYVSGKAIVLQPSVIEAATWAILANVTARSNQSDATCSRLDGKGCPLTEQDCVFGRCVLPTAHFHDAHSLALTPNGYLNFDLDPAKAPPDDPVWTEPFWSAQTGAALFLDRGPIATWVVFAAGIAIALGLLAAIHVLVPPLLHAWNIN
jgi:hypothetical protein